MSSTLPSQSDIQTQLSAIAEKQGISAALNALYDWSFSVNYLTSEKLEDNLRYTYFDPEFEVTFKAQINIARSRYQPPSPATQSNSSIHCPICFENIGAPGKEGLRAFEFELLNEPFFAQLTPFPLYPKHFVLVKKAKDPMRVSPQSLKDMMDFCQKAPNYTVFSNSDIEWAGASILAHHHYQAIEHLKLPITEAKPFLNCEQNVSEVQLSLLHFPIATFKLSSQNPQKLLELGAKVLKFWRGQDNPPSAKDTAEFHGPHQNTCNLMLYQSEGTFFAYLLLRNPHYRTPPELLRIKSEGVGVIEVCGEGIYPVPSSPDIQQEIEQQGLSILKKIILGNNPLPIEEYQTLFKSLLNKIS